MPGSSLPPVKRKQVVSRSFSGTERTEAEVVLWKEPGSTSARPDSVVPGILSGEGLWSENHAWDPHACPGLCWDSGLGPSKVTPVPV